MATVKVAVLNLAMQAFWIILIQFAQQEPNSPNLAKKEEQFYDCADLPSLAPTYNSFKICFFHEAFVRARNRDLHVIRTTD